MTVTVATGVTTRMWRPSWFAAWSPTPPSKPQIWTPPPNDKPYVPPTRLGYGSSQNDTGDPIGGGATYSNILTSGDYNPTNKATFLAAAAAAGSGEVIYIAPAVSIDLSGETNIYLDDGVILASNRGSGGSSGGKLYNHDTGSGTYKFFLRLGVGCRICGLQLEGPEPDYQCDYKAVNPYAGLEADSTCEIDNCEIDHWSNGGVYCKAGKTGILVHHNYIHHNQMSGLGYGVNVVNASVLVEANLFDYGRHYIAAQRDTPCSSYEARYNICYDHCTNTMFDCHGGNDPEYKDASICAGGTLLIHHNDFLTSKTTCVKPRGIPSVKCEVYRNWAYWTYSSPTSGAFRQQLDNLPGYTPYINMLVHDNWLSTNTPPA